jgi:hypothetical protein
VNAKIRELPLSVVAHFGEERFAQGDSMLMNDVLARHLRRPDVSARFMRRPSELPRVGKLAGITLAFNTSESARRILDRLARLRAAKGVPIAVSLREFGGGERLAQEYTGLKIVRVIDTPMMLSLGRSHLHELLRHVLAKD